MPQIGNYVIKSPEILQLSKLAPVDWRTFVKRLQELGFKGPYSGGKHAYMQKGDLI